MKYLSFFLLFFFFNSCKNTDTKTPTITTIKTVKTPQLTIVEANRLVNLPLACINVEYPNKLGQTIGSEKDLQSPSNLHPAFYGCFDWHSSVHGHWSLVSLLKRFPDLEKAVEIKQQLLSNLSKNNILAEVAYFEKPYNKSYERTYGWAWILKLAEEIHTWNDPIARKLEQNLQPLTTLIVEKYVAFLPKLNYPIRVGEHTNTAFGLTFAWDYAVALQDDSFKKIIKKNAERFYLNDVNCPISWEPSGYDFLSPCLQEAAIMKRILSKQKFIVWIHSFLPELKDPNFTLPFGKVSDRTDGKLVHLDGVNFSRAWCLLKIAEDLPAYKHLKNSANAHINYSLPNIVSDNYEGSHWLGSFAIYALNSVNND